MNTEEFSGVLDQQPTVDRRARSVEEVFGAPMTLALSGTALSDFLGIARCFGFDEYAYAVTPNVDHVLRHCDDPSFRSLYAAARFVLLDSRFLAHLIRATTGVKLPVCPGSDLVAHLFDEVIASDDIIVLIGSTDAKAQILRQKYGLRHLRHHNPPMGFVDDPEAVEATLQFVELQGPFRFCLLAVGCPQQEMIAQALKTRKRAKGLALCIGASIDFITGGERRAPAWMAAVGMEWLFRLAQNPCRLAGRYLIRGPRIFVVLPRLEFRIRSRRSDRLC